MAIPEERDVILRKTAFPAVIRERRDYSSAVYGPDGETAVKSGHMPVHVHQFEKPGDGRFGSARDSLRF